MTDRSASRPGLWVPLLPVRFAPGRGTSSASRGWPCLSRPSGGQLSAWPAVLEHDALNVFAVGLVGMGGSTDHLSPSVHWVGDLQAASGTDLLAVLLNNIVSFEPVALPVLR